jgi:hypothetical protein
MLSPINTLAPAPGYRHSLCISVSKKDNGEAGMTTEKDPVAAACEAEWDKWKSDCSGFVKAVALRLGIKITGMANPMIDYLEHSTAWRSLGSDSGAAITRASQGDLVVGGLKAPRHGHVVIVIKSAPLRYPIGYWGRFGAVGKKRAGINWSWNKSDLPKVQFYARKP